jgi:hypothetical protein
VGKLISANQALLVGFELDAVIEIAGFDAVITFGAAVAIDLAFFLSATEFFDFVIEAEEVFEAGEVEFASGNGDTNGAACVVAVFAVGETALQGEFF